VNPRLWEAAHLFHAEGSDEATAFVRTQMLLVLKGKAKQVIDDLRQTGATLRGKAARLRKLCKFMEKNLHRMHYGRYLRAGYPIATGRDRGRVPARGQGPDGTRGHAVEDPGRPGDAGTADDRDQRRLGGVPAI